VKEQYIDNNSTANIFLSIFQRILRAAGACDFDNFGQLVKQLDHTSLKDNNIKDFAKSFFQALIMKLDVNSSLTSFTLLVDEIMFVFKQINDVDPGFTMNHFENALLILKSAMLDVSYRGAGNKAVNIALVISSLDIKPLGVTSSGRPIAPLDIDSFLNPEEIVSSWWLPSLGVVDFSGTDKFRLGLIASTIGNMPRIVESVLPLLKDIVEISGNRRDVIDAAAVQLIFK